MGTKISICGTIMESQLVHFSSTDELDLVSELVGAKRSPATRREYRKDLDGFFSFFCGRPADSEAIAAFLGLGKNGATAAAVQFKRSLLSRNLAPATINRRIAALKSLVRLAENLGRIDWNLSGIASEKAQVYRDTSGISRQEFQKVLVGCDRDSLQGLRDYAILCLLWANALRRGELVATNIEDFDADSRALWIRGKGRAQKEKVDLSRQTTDAILGWLRSRKCLDASQPLFCALDRSSYGRRLSGESIYSIVGARCKEAGISKRMSPHRIRHSAITAALDMTDGNLRKVQRLSRHKKIETLLIYDDNRQQMQLELSEMLSEFL